MGLFHKIAAAGLSLMMTVGLLTGCSGNTNQLDLPKKGEEIAVLKVKDYGEMDGAEYIDGGENLGTEAVE